MGDQSKLPVQARLKSSGLSVGDLARLTGVRASAIRYYEASGLLPAPERRSGRRRYDRDAAKRLEAILTAHRLGFSIAEIKRLAVADIHGWRQEAQAKSLCLKALIERLSANAAQLDELSKCDCATGSACRL